MYKVLMFGLAILIAGCSRHQESGRLLAATNDSRLYMGEVATRVDTNSAYAVRNYVTQWVSRQLLYDEAKKEGLDDNAGFRENVADYSLELAVTSLLNKKVYGVPIEVTDADISKYYDSHQNELRATDEMACVNLAALKKRSTAVSLRNALVSGSSWNEVFTDISTGDVAEIKDSAYVTSSSVKPAIWNVIGSLEEHKVSFPIQLDSLNYVVQLVKKLNAGDLLPISYASNQIKEKLTIDRRRFLYNALLDSLRAEGNFQIDPKVAVKDTNIEE